MSNFYQPTLDPRTKKTVQAEWLDDYFGPHRYGVRFPDGKVFSQREVLDATVQESQARRTRRSIAVCLLSSVGLLVFVWVAYLVLMICLQVTICG